MVHYNNASIMSKQESSVVHTYLKTSSPQQKYWIRKRGFTRQLVKRISDHSENWLKDLEDMRKFVQAYKQDIERLHQARMVVDKSFGEGRSPIENIS